MSECSNVVFVIVKEERRLLVTVGRLFTAVSCEKLFVAGTSMSVGVGLL